MKFAQIVAACLLATFLLGQSDAAEEKESVVMVFFPDTPNCTGTSTNTVYGLCTADPAKAKFGRFRCTERTGRFKEVVRDDGCDAECASSCQTTSLRPAATENDNNLANAAKAYPVIDKECLTNGNQSWAYACTQCSPKARPPCDPDATPMKIWDRTEMLVLERINASIAEAQAKEKEAQAAAQGQAAKAEMEKLVLDQMIKAGKDAEEKRKEEEEELAKEHTKAEELRKEVEKEMQNDALASQPLSGLPERQEPGLQPAGQDGLRDLPERDTSPATTKGDTSTTHTNGVTNTANPTAVTSAPNPLTTESKTSASACMAAPLAAALLPLVIALAAW